MKALEQRWDAWQARREERRALRALGASLPPSAEVAVVDERLAALESTLALSMARDRADYAAVSAWARPLVVLRGLLDRAVLRALRHRAAKDRTAVCELLGAASLDSARGLAADAARAARDAAQAAGARLRPMPLAVREAQHFSRFLWKEGQIMLVPRLPALAGLAAGWWIAQTFTDSQLTATLHSWGLGAGPRRAVSSETLHAMSFWLPLLAAAVSSYAGSRLAALIRSRYSPAPGVLDQGRWRARADRS